MLGKVLTLASAGNAAPAGYQISRSLRFNSADSAYLNRTPASAGNRKTWTWSGWVKRSGLGSIQGIFTEATSGFATFGRFQFTAGDLLEFDGNFGGTRHIRDTVAVFRDVSAWYHLVLVLDTTQATDTNRIKLYVNGTQISLATAVTGSWPSQNSDGDINLAQAHSIGRREVNNDAYFNGYLTEIHFVDGQALTPNDFGETDETTGVWKPIAYAGTYGTNGFYLNFSDNTSTTTLGEDQAGSNDWTLNNFSVAAGAGNDSLVDTPTPYGTDTGAGGEVRSNYATLNPLAKGTSTTISNGNLLETQSAYNTSSGTIYVSSGKWYAEFIPQPSAFSYNQVGIVREGAFNPNTRFAIGTGQSGAYCYLGFDGSKYNNGTGSAYGAAWGGNSGDIIGVALDLDSGTLEFFKNGVSQGVAYSSLPAGFYTFACGHQGESIYVNFGQRPFAYTAPSGFKALCTQNLPTPSVADGSEYFNTVLWTGNGTVRDIQGTDFQPDFVWIKGRSQVSNHFLFDAIRGATNRLCSSLTVAEASEPNTLTAFLSDGFSLGTDAGVGACNISGQTYAAWNWNAGGSNATNTDGTITSTVRANPTAGFSVVSWTTQASGTATVGHGLGVAPAMFIIKARTVANNWWVYHQSLATPQSNAIALNLTNAALGSTNLWNNTAPTSSVISFSADWIGSNPVILYAFAEVEGHSKFGRYTGNGSTDGSFVYCGFRPAWILLKSPSNASDWWLVDNTRSPANVSQLWLRPNLSNTENTGAILIDILSNGFKLRSAGGNDSGWTWLFMAFAENPFKYSLAR